MPSISIIVITYNSEDTIFECLTSILLQKEDNVEVIIVDNGSHDKTIGIIKDKFSEAILICNENNLGYSGAINQGIRKARGDYILVLNSDVTLGKKFIKKFSIQLEQLPDNIGMISPKIMRRDGKIDSTGIFLSQIRKMYDRGKECKDGSFFSLPTYIFGPCGACAIYKRDMLENVRIENEYFDEDFFMLIEDFDIAWRANLLGWKGRFMPELKCFHRGGISRNKSKFAQYYAFRNRYLLLIKNESEFGLFKLLFFVWVYDLPRLIYLLFTNTYTPRALREIRQLLPTMIKKRYLIKRQKKILENKT